MGMIKNWTRIKATEVELFGDGFSFTNTDSWVNKESTPPKVLILGKFKSNHSSGYFLSLLRQTNTEKVGKATWKVEWEQTTKSKEASTKDAMKFMRGNP